MKLLLLVLLTFNSYAIPNKDSLLDNDVKLSKSDLNAADLIFNLNLELRKNRVSTYTTKKTIRSIKKNSIFKDYLSSIEVIHQIAQSNNFKTKLKKCSNFSPKSSYLNPIKNKLDTRIKRYCYYNLFSKINNKNIKFILDDRSFFKKSILYITTKYPRKINKFLTNINNVYKEESIRLISEVIFENNLKPSKKLISLLKVTPELTNYVQENGLASSSDSKYFIRVFNSLKNKSKSSLKNKDFNKLKSTTSELISFYNENKNYIPKKYAWKSFTLIAYDTLYSGNKEIAKDIFSYTMKISTGDQFEDSAFYLLWSDLLYHDIKSAIKTIEKKKYVENFNKLGSRTKFWTAMTLQKNGETSIAKHLYKLIYKSSPLNFYSILSMKKINEIDSKTKHSHLVKQYRTSKEIFKIPKEHFTKDLELSLLRIKAWISTEHSSYAESELTKIIASSKDTLLKKSEYYSDYSDQEVRRYLSIKLIKSFNSSGNYLQTFKLLYRSFNSELFHVSERSLKFLFPFDYLKEIEKIDNTIDPLLVLSLIRQESAFNPNAKSRVGARGLMQIMPQTAKSMNKRVVASHLKTPDTNIKLGIRYLKKLLSKHDGNLIYALASYNAGPTRVNKWISNHFRSEDPLYILESIPYRETRNYVKLIYRNIFFYNLLQDNNRLALSTSESFYTKLKR